MLSVSGVRKVIGIERISASGFSPDGIGLVLAHIPLALHMFSRLRGIGFRNLKYIIHVCQVRMCYYSFEYQHFHCRYDEYLACCHILSSRQLIRTKAKNTGVVLEGDQVELLRYSFDEEV